MSVFAGRAVFPQSFTDAFGNGRAGLTITVYKRITYTDGVTTINATRLTSATAAFTSADAGKTINAQNFPSGVTIATYVSPTQVDLSSPATATGTARSFTIAARQRSADLATVYVDRLKTVATSNPYVADANGTTFPYLDPGDYDAVTVHGVIPFSVLPDHEDVEGAVSGLPSHLGDALDAHDAAAISVVPVGGIASLTVQAALAELDAEKQPAGDYVTTGGDQSIAGNKSPTGDWSFFKSARLYAGDPFIAVPKPSGSAATDTANLRAVVRDSVELTAEAGQNAQVRLGRGRYLIDADNIFGDLGAVTNQIGPLFQGAGMDGTVLALVTGGAEKWFYNNGASARLARAVWENMRFETDSATLGNGFNLTGGGHEQGNTWRRCRFETFATLLKLGGTLGNDSHRFFDSVIRNIYGRVLHIDNPQVLATEFFGVNMELIYGDVVYVGTGGGGDVAMWGGSVIFRQNGTDTTPRWLLHVEPSSNVSAMSNGRFSFNDQKYEFGNPYAGLVKALGDTGSVAVSFNDDSFFHTASASREAVHVGINRQITFSRCSIPDYFTYRIDSTAGFTTQPDPGTLDFIDSKVPVNLPDLITIVTELGRARGLRNRPISAVTDRTALDFDRGWRSNTTSDSGPTLKRASFKRAAQSFPSAAAGAIERTVKLPRDSIIVNVVVRKPASGTSTAAHALKVGNNDKTVTYATSTSASGQMKDEHNILAKDVFVDVGTDANKQTLRLWSDPSGAEAHTAGWAYVEYL